MTDDEVLGQIPENWLDLVDQSEKDDVTIAVTKEFIGLAANHLGLKHPSQDQVTIEYAKSLDMSVEEVRESIRLIVNLRTTTRLFVRLYGHLFPQDENGDPIMRPAEIARIHGETEEVILEALEEIKDELVEEDLIHEWPDVEGEFLH
jgi:predicted Zn-dependent peptidase